MLTTIRERAQGWIAWVIVTIISVPFALWGINEYFDAQLRAQDSRMGIRGMAVIESLANLHYMPLEHKIAMPANNFILVFKKS